ncbi:MAG TPA: ABC transporter permease [Candidatus Dormibacteraeota bacterium]|nr:ABC transporter permease [Candidatus Dormibacteraeota bacterium]
MNPVLRALWNPIVAKEYRSRMRTWRSPLTITIHVLILGGVGWAVFSVIANTMTNLGSGLSPSSMGITVFTFLVLFQVALLAFITPALTAGSISGERERQTIDLLFVTPLAPFSIIWGKLLASMSFVVLLIVLSIPIFSLVFLFGGIELDQVVAAFALTGVTAMMLGFLGVAFSTMFRRTLAATVASYGAAFVVLVGSPAFGLVFPTEYGAQTVPAPPAVTMISPVVPLLVVAYQQPLPGYGVRPSATLQQQVNKGLATGGYCTSTYNGGVVCSSTGNGLVNVPGGQNPGAALPSGLFAGWQYWQASIVMQLMICAAALALSAFLLPPIRRFAVRRKAIPVTAPA